MQAVRCTPMNSIVFIHDSAGADGPLPYEHFYILANDQAIIVGCYPEQDGETAITLAGGDEIQMPMEPDFDGTIRTPSCRVVVTTVESEELLDQPVAETMTRIRVWRSHPKWPEQVTIIVG